MSSTRLSYKYAYTSYGYTGSNTGRYHDSTKFTILHNLAQLLTLELGYDVCLEERNTSRGTKEYIFQTKLHGSCTISELALEDAIHVGHLKYLKKEITEGLNKTSTKLKSLLDGI